MIESKTVFSASRKCTGLFKRKGVFSLFWVSNHLQTITKGRLRDVSNTSRSRGVAKLFEVFLTIRILHVRR